MKLATLVIATMILFSTIGCKKDEYKVPQPHVWTELLPDSTYKYMLALDEQDILENRWSLVYYEESTQQWCRTDGRYLGVGSHVPEFYIYKPTCPDAYYLLVDWNTNGESTYTMSRTNRSVVKKIMKRNFWSEMKKL